MKKGWTIEYEEWNKKDHPLQEALCTLGNGYFATRAALEFYRDNDFNYPGTYLAGGYNRLKSVIQKKEIENEDLVNWPNWLFLTFKIGDGKWLDLVDVEILEYTTTLDLEAGYLLRKIRFRDSKKRETTLISKRIVSMNDYHVAAIEWQIIPENWSGKITIRSGIDGDIINNNVARYRELNQGHIEVLEKDAFFDNSIYLISRTKQSKILMTQAAKTNIYIKEKKQSTKHKVINKKGFIAGDFQIKCSRQQPIRIEKLVSLYTSRDFAISDPLTEAKTKIQRLTTFSSIAAKHCISWSQIWKYNDIKINADFEDQFVLRLHIFHLYQTVSKNSIGYDIGIPARGWHGEAYRGHIFWDEIYILPFINLHQPELAKSLLMYRYRRLTEAYEMAKEIGCRGALFPWQSGSNGREETQKMHLNPKSGRWLPDVSHLQYHINAAVPLNVWHYYQCSDDMDFLVAHGAEIIIATALFWSSLAHYNPQRDRYEIHNVMGPDEYHTHYPGTKEPGLNNNAYTNIMAVWVLQHALELLNILDDTCANDLAEKIGFTHSDLQRWQDITQKMYVPFYDGDIIMQFEGFEKLKELDWDHYHKKYGEHLRLDRILESEGDSPNHYKASKQADVLMLFYIFSSSELEKILKKLNYDFDPQSIPKNIEYYEKRTAHGSTLSQVIHSWVYARSHREQSWKSFKSALMSDFKDVQGGTTHEGIHLGAMAGTMDLIQRCYSGLDIRDNILWLEPTLPDDIKSMKFHVHYRGHWINLTINHKKLRLEFDKGWSNPVKIGFRDKVFLLKKDDTKEFKL
ncbi:MAG: glycoside hydrolase family 65 protein [Candidatus Cloacimonetes bacterium]|nr:glycoside hydrolase family 65 protein [Candidatus Cloacimonadota bacterium]